VIDYCLIPDDDPTVIDPVEGSLRRSGSQGPIRSSVGESSRGVADKALSRSASAQPQCLSIEVGG
jgi:N-acyl-L-homoserine lactone synthetase